MSEKPKCLFIISGLSRTFKKTHLNIFNNIIIPNMQNIDFDIYIYIN